MTAFLWAISITLALVGASKIVALATQYFPPRTADGEAIDLAVIVVLLLWAVVLLAGG